MDAKQHKRRAVTALRDVAHSLGMTPERHHSDMNAIDFRNLHQSIVGTPRRISSAKSTIARIPSAKSAFARDPNIKYYLHPSVVMIRSWLVMIYHDES